MSIEDDVKSVISRLEEAIHVDPGRRGLERIFERTRGSLASATESLRSATRVAVATGFFVPAGAPETDGPLGAAALVKAISATGVAVDLISDPECSRVVCEVVKFLQSQKVDTRLRIFAGPASSSALANNSVDTEAREAAKQFELLHTDDAWAAYARKFLNEDSEAEKHGPYTHLISIERLGAAVNGKYYSMSGIDLTSRTGPVDRLFEFAREQGIQTICIGDGGNEIGMGNVRFLVETDVPNGRQIGSCSLCEHLICCGVSNWGGYALAAALKTVFKFSNPHFNLDDEDELLSNISDAGAVDGVTGKVTTSLVDGLDRSTVHTPIMNRIIQLIA
eukprot:CAMPEP_0198734640 /NCGR_PEP_ID=MMETSP1475-20131203/54140_1 /TAXON_ID= ORGANISM="Unidentified sp., Strain CCMP1999" /NCGR_SAMPLE_ID=MMETSP1475 /ASSEMBLY_ACC=CAM_ASM_001111 /LENGTH=334 /DNA_ID=CAMNT_0044498153 /DNA_START=82 /DNA_END=1086 /DNA_ORIENTATION=-